MSATSRACRARGLLENDTDTWTNGQHYTAADRRPTNYVSARGKLNGEVAGHAGHARFVVDILARMLLGCYAENGPVEFRLKTRDTDGSPRRDRRTTTTFVVRPTTELTSQLLPPSRMHYRLG